MEDENYMSGVMSSNGMSGFVAKWLFLRFVSSSMGYSGCGSHSVWFLRCLHTLHSLFIVLNSSITKEHIFKDPVLAVLMFLDYHSVQKESLNRMILFYSL